MSKKKSKAVVLEDCKAHHDLQTETDAIRSKLKAANQRKSILAAQVRFLRKRHKYLVTFNNNNMSPSQELKTNVHARNLLGQTKIPKERLLIADESSQRILPCVPEPKGMKQHDMAEQTVTTAHKKTSLGGKQAAKRISTPVSNSNQKEKRPSRKEVVAPNATDKIPAFDLNEASFPNFDLNETSTGMMIS